MAKLFSSQNIRESIAITGFILLIIYLFSNNKVLGLIGFLCFGSVQSYDFFTKYKNTGNISWLDIIYILGAILAAINISFSIF